jgi:hypothetical protein
MTPPAYHHAVATRKSKPFVVFRSLGSDLMLDDPGLMGVMTGGARDAPVVKGQLDSDPLHRFGNDLKNLFWGFHEVIAPHRMSSVEPVVTNRTVFVNGFIVETHVLYSQDLSVWQGCVTKQARLVIDGTPRVQLGVSIHLAVSFLAMAPEAKFVAYRVTSSKKIRVVFSHRKLPLPTLLEWRIVTSHTG